jgi:hypothetical protein
MRVLGKSYEFLTPNKGFDLLRENQIKEEHGLHAPLLFGTFYKPFY